MSLRLPGPLAALCGALLRAWARLVGVGALTALAVGGITVAVFALGNPEGSLGLGRLAELLHLPEARDWLTDTRSALEADGPLARVALASGVAALVLGLVTLVGALLPAPRRRLALPAAAGGTSDHGRAEEASKRLSARPRAVARALATAIARDNPDVERVVVRVRPRRRGVGGRALALVTLSPSASRAGHELERARALARKFEVDLRARLKRTRPSRARSARLGRAERRARGRRVTYG